MKLPGLWRSTEGAVLACFLWQAASTFAFDANTVSNLTLWLKADTGVQTNGSGGVTNWLDQSGSGRHATLLSGSPSNAADVINSKPAIWFDGYGDTLTFSRLTNIWTVFWVLNEDPAATANYRPLLGDSSYYDFHRADGSYFWDSGNASINIRNGTTYTNGYSVGSGTGTRVPTSLSIITLKTAGPVRADQLGRDRGVVDRVWHGMIAEILVYTHALSSNDLKTVGTYLSQKYLIESAYVNLNPQIPRVQNNPMVSAIDRTAASLSGMLTSTGDAPTTVAFFWGPADGGTNPAAWGSTNTIGIRPEGAITANLSDLTEDTLYYGTFSASNATARKLASPSIRFRTALDTLPWGRRQKLRLKGYTRGESLTNFPFLVIFRKDEPGFSYDWFLSPPYNDLRFVDSNSVSLNYDVDHWDTDSNSFVWVQIPRLRTTNDWVWAYWCRRGQDTPVSTTNGMTWSQAFGGVWHFSEAVLNGGIQKDSGQYGNHGIFQDVNGSSTAGTLIGPLARADYLSGDADFVHVQHHNSIQPGGALSCEVWARSSPANWNNDGCLVSRRDVYIMHPSIGSRTVGFYVSAPGFYSVGYTPPEITNWHYYAGTYDGATLRFYFDGRVVNSAAAGSPPIRSDTGFLTLGRDDGLERYLNGWIDEVRISTAARSSNWIWTTWFNQVSNRAFIEYGPVEDVMRYGTTLTIQ